MAAHQANKTKDGRITNPQIGRLLNQPIPEPDADLDREYREFCSSLGFTANERGAIGVQRKFRVL